MYMYMATRYSSKIEKLPFGRGIGLAPNLHEPCRQYDTSPTCTKRKKERKSFIYPHSPLYLNLPSHVDVQFPCSYPIGAEVHLSFELRPLIQLAAAEFNLVTLLVATLLPSLWALGGRTYGRGIRKFSYTMQHNIRT